MLERKKGEQEAMIILENLGIEIDQNYGDDNSGKSKADIKCKDGRYIEVTHTLHNNAIFTGRNKFCQLQPGESGSDCTKRQLKIEEECSRVLDRIHKYDYEKDETGKLTSAGQVQFLSQKKFRTFRDKNF